jgi:hypothetical protein
VLLEQVKRVLLVKLVKPERRVLLGLPELQERLELPVKLERRERRERLVQLGLPELPEQEKRVLPVKPERQERRVLLGLPELLE